MKPLLHMAFCGIFLLAGIAFGIGTASAHTMPRFEAVLLYELSGEDGADPIEFAWDMPLQKAEDILGSNFNEEEKESESFRIVRYEYGDITFGGMAQRSSSRPTGEIPVRFIECRDPSFRTPSGFRVGDSYEDVRAMYGKGEWSSRGGETYLYWFNEAESMSFTVDEDGRIEEIGLHVVLFG